jgi:hypothetical protein
MLDDRQSGELHALAGDDCEFLAEVTAVLDSGSDIWETHTYCYGDYTKDGGQTWP